MFGGGIGEFINGAIWLAAVIALFFTGWRATHRGVFRAVSESYYGRKAQLFGGACLTLAVIAGIGFVWQLLGYAVGGLSVGALFFLIGAGFGGYFTYRYYARTV
jgi:hypothetical protein